MAADPPEDGKILRFPGTSAPPAPPGRKRGSAASPAPTAREKAALAGLSEEQQRALHIILSGMPYVMIGVQPTATGADFFTSVAGSLQVLSDAQPHLPGVIDRALARRQ